MSKIFWERRAVRVTLESQLQSSGWDNIAYKEGWGDPENVDVIEPPQMTIDVIPVSRLELELGRVTTTQVYPRSVQIDIYMEREERVRTLEEEIFDIFDTTVFQIKDAADVIVGYILSSSSEDIQIATFPPIITPEIMRWRGVVQSLMLAHYPNA